MFINRKSACHVRRCKPSVDSLKKVNRCNLGYAMAVYFFCVILSMIYRTSPVMETTSANIARISLTVFILYVPPFIGVEGAAQL